METVLKRLRYYLFGDKSIKEGPIVTLGILVICVVVFIGELLITTKYGSEINSMIALGGYYRNYVVILKQYWRFITYGFVHGDILHLFMNMYALFNLGTMLESIVGHKKFALVMVFSVIGGGFLAHLSSSELVVGLSGGLYGLIGLLCVIAYKSNWFKVPHIRASFMRTLFINLLISFMPSVSMAGHIGGLVIGLLFGLIYTTPNAEKKSIFYYNKIFATCLCIIILSVLVVRDNKILKLYSNDISVLEIYNDFGFDVDEYLYKIYNEHVGG